MNTSASEPSTIQCCTRRMTGKCCETSTKNMCEAPSRPSVHVTDPTRNWPLSYRGRITVHLPTGSRARARCDQRGSEFAPEPRHEHLHRVRVAVGVLAVDVLGQLALRDDPSAVVHQVGEDAELMAGEPNGVAAGVTSAERGSSATSPPRRSGAGLPAGAPDQRAHPRQHFFHLERLRDVVVGAAVDPLHLLVPATARRQHQHGTRCLVAPAAEHGQAVDVRQAEVEHDGVVPSVCQEIGAFAVGGAVHRVTGVASALSALATAAARLRRPAPAQRLYPAVRDPLLNGLPVTRDIPVSFRMDSGCCR